MFTSRDLVLAASALLVTLALVIARLVPPAPLSVDAPAERFSAGRAAAVLEQVLGDGQPHPVGSEANARVREQIVSRLRALGYEVETQAKFVCGDYAVCAPIVNVIARREGREPGAAVALVAHYDSVPAGPGASDDGAGVAALLEIARIVSLDPPSRHDLVFLFTDGEEAGLLGARAFVDHHPLAHDIRAVVNVEARGTRGPSLLFETSGDDAFLIDLFARHAPHPVTSSLFSAVYERMPSDSDLSVFRRRGIRGVNFAFLSGVEHYHTPLDDIAHLSLASLQDHGEHALAMARALADADLKSPPPGNAVYFDVLSLGVIRWNAELSLPLAALASTAMSLLLFGFIRRGSCTMGDALRGLMAFLLSPAIALSTALGLGQMFTLLGVTRGWVAYPAAFIVAFVATGILGVTVSASFTRKDSPLGTHAGIWLGWAIIAVAVSALLPGASYLPLVPAIGAVLSGALLQKGSPRGLWLTALVLLPALLLAIAWFPILAILYDAVGLAAMPILSAAVALVVGSLLPFASCLGHERLRRIIPAPALLSIGGALFAGLLPISSAEVPERLSLSFHHDTDADLTHWLAHSESGHLPESLRATASFGPRALAALPWSPVTAFVAPADATKLEAPAVEVLSRSSLPDGRHLQLHVKAEASSTLTLAIPPEASIGQVTIEGERAAHRKNSGWKVLTVRGMPEGGVRIAMALNGQQPVDITLASSSSGLPPEGEALASSRPKHAVPSQDGDVTVVSRRLKL